MKKLPKLSILLLLFLIPFESLAQSLGIKAGVNISTFSMKDNDRNYDDDFTTKAGFHVGMSAEMKLPLFLSFESGIYLSTKGYKGTTSVDDNNKVEVKETLYYLDIPFYLKVSIGVSEIKAYANAGPYIGIGLSGNKKIDTTILGENTTKTEDIKWGKDDDDDLQRFDLGLNVGAGVEIGLVNIGVSYGFGLVNISSVTTNGLEIHNRVLGISMGFKF